MALIPLVDIGQHLLRTLASANLIGLRAFHNLGSYQIHLCEASRFNELLLQLCS